MLAVLVITALFVALSIYFFFRAEKLQHTLLRLKREATNASKENTTLTNSMALIASNHEEFAKIRLQKLLASNENHKRADNAELIKPLINNYVIIFGECLKGKGQLQTITKKCFDSQGTNNYKEFVNKVIKNDVKTQRLWASNNLIGFISLVEVLLVKYGDIGASSDLTQKNGVNDCQK